MVGKNVLFNFAVAIHPVVGLVQEVTAKYVTWPVHLIFYELVHATAPLIFG